MNLRHALVVLATAAALGCAAPPGPALRWRGDFDVLVRPYQRAVVYDLDEGSDLAALDALRTSPERARSPLYLWIDVGRSEKLAAAHPEWVSGMGSHGDWRRLFPGAPKPGPNERIGMYPWTPIWYRAVLEDRIAAITRLLRGRTEGVAGVFLDHVQGAPSACGCGNLQCRWTADYLMAGGPEKVEGSPVALLVTALAKEMPGLAWIPVLVIECEEADQPGEGSTGKCGSVGCFKGRCWKESTKELEGLLAATDGPIAFLSDEQTFGRIPEHYAAASRAWRLDVLQDLEELPPRFQRPPLPAARVIFVERRPEGSKQYLDVEAWASLRGARGVLFSRAPFDESWDPRLIPFASSAKAAPAQGHGHE